MFKEVMTRKPIEARGFPGGFLTIKGTSYEIWGQHEI